MASARSSGDWFERRFHTRDTSRARDLTIPLRVGDGVFTLRRQSLQTSVGSGSLFTAFAPVAQPVAPLLVLPGGVVHLLIHLWRPGLRQHVKYACARDVFSLLHTAKSAHQTSSFAVSSSPVDTNPNRQRSDLLHRQKALEMQTRSQPPLGMHCTRREILLCTLRSHPQIHRERPDAVQNRMCRIEVATLPVQPLQRFNPFFAKGRRRRGDSSSTVRLHFPHWILAVSAPTYCTVILRP
jgi:hypothetical protein